AGPATNVANSLLLNSGLGRTARTAPASRRGIDFSGRALANADCLHGLRLRSPLATRQLGSFCHPTPFFSRPRGYQSVCRDSSESGSRSNRTPSPSGRTNPQSGDAGSRELGGIREAPARRDADVTPSTRSANVPARGVTSLAQSRKGAKEVW